MVSTINYYLQQRRRMNKEWQQRSWPIELYFHEQKKILLSKYPDNEILQEAYNKSKEHMLKNYGHTIEKLL